MIASLVGTLDLKSEKTKIVSGSRDETIKVWDSGAFWAPNRPSLTKTDRSCLPVQPHWSCRSRRRAPTATGSARWHFPQTGARSCPARTTRRSKSGILVRFGPQIASPWPKLTVPRLPCSHTRAEERTDQRPQRHDLVRPLLARWKQNRLRVV